jgi:heptosyltransferase-3
MSLAPQTPPRTILVIVTRRIGDVLLATPLIRSLKCAWPQARIEALVFAGTQGVLAGNPDLDAVHAVPERPSFGQHLALLARLLRRHDLALSLVPGDRPTLYAWLGGKTRMGLLLDRPDQRWKRRFLDRWVAFDPDDTHTLRNHLALADALGIATQSDVVLSWQDSDHAAVDALIGGPCGALAVLHPWPKFRYKQWREDGWVEVARWLIEQGFRVALSGSPDPAEKAHVDAIARQLPDGVVNAAGRLTLGGTAALIARARLYVGPDTAITHVAAASGVPTLALFGPTDPVKWGPWPQGHPAARNPWQRVGDQRVGNVQLVQGRAPCVPCGQEGCDRHIASTSDCLQQLPADRIISYLKTMVYASTR